jgi:dienelactone hydrolase
MMMSSVHLQFFHVRAVPRKRRLRRVLDVAYYQGVTSRGAVFAVALTVLTAVSPAWAQTVAPPTDVAFSDDARKFRLAGYLYRPTGRGPFPAVVMMHGCGGVRSRQHDWAQRLRTWGYVALIVDGFGPRGKTNICYDFLGVDPRFARMPDAYAAKSFLVRQPFVDGGRIVLMGWSHGGATTLFAVDDIYLAGIRSTPFTAVIAFYPSCLALMQRVNAPLLILIGEDDDWTAASACRNMLRSTEQWERRAAANITLKVYPGAHHGFDQRQPPRQMYGHTVGGHPVAAAQAEEEVKGFLARHLRNG